MKRDIPHLIEIQRSIALIAKYVAVDRSPSAMAIDAIKYQLIVIGEASGRLSDECRSRAPDVQWQRIRGQRNYLAHQYGDVDDERILRVYSEYLVPLHFRIVQLLTFTEEE